MLVSPGSTYRVQLHSGFGFHAAGEIAEYLAALGITHLYCSPILEAVPGSTHGYDVIDPQRLSDEHGGAPGYAKMVGSLRDAGLGQVLDIVPNHMAVHPANQWWWDVLENGPASRYAEFFDIDWQGPDERSAFTVLVPVLDDHYGRVLEAGELIVFRSGGAFCLRYHDHRLPISPRTLDELLGAAARRAGSAELAELAQGFGALPPARMTDRAAVFERHAAKVELADRLERLYTDRPDLAEAVDAELVAFNGDADRLDTLLRRQNYRLARWRTASEELDYRRFFNIEGLIGIRSEEPEVFAETHALILQLVHEGVIDGLRIDHVDGLRDPARYLRRVADATGGIYTVVEKILEPREHLPPSWSAAGTSGYDFMIRVGNLFVETAHEPDMTACYASFTGRSVDYADAVRSCKHQIMREELTAEVDRLVRLLAAVCADHRRHRDHTRRELRDALREVVANYPVYRTYVTRGRPADASERSHIAAALVGAASHRPDIDTELLAFLGELAAGDHDGPLEGEFAERLQQLTAPVMAKGVEDTAFYRYHRLVSLNEVGGDPATFGAPVDTFHEATADAAEDWPQSMLTLSTHDTKRSADVRARLHVLSEVPDAWRTAVRRWAEVNGRHRRGAWPDRNTEYLLYQTLVGAWPIEVDRVVAFMAKATKEAKVHTSWVDPVADYDDAVRSFSSAILGDETFLTELHRFLDTEEIVARGFRNSLAQTALLLTCPGVPDVYQGNELWDLSLVDPDNRRPVDFARRRALLDKLVGAGPTDALALSETGAPKLWLTQRLLAHRRAQPDAYQSGLYEPLTVRGPRSRDIVAFTRGRLAVVVPCRTAPGWAGTTVDLPAGRWRALTSEGTHDSGSQPVGELLHRFPVAVLTRD